MARTIVVVPCYNEAKRLDVRAFQKHGRRSESAHLLFVNDGSRDETLSVIGSLRDEDPFHFSVFDLPRNRGKAEAVRLGMQNAIAAGAEYVGFWDADLATPLEDIAAFERVLDAKPEMQLVIGSRMYLLGRRIERKQSRYWLGRVFARSASLALGLRVFDTQCGAKLFRVTPALESALGEPFLARWIFDVEIFARLKCLQRRLGGAPLSEAVFEAPLDAWRDVGGSTLKSRDFLKAPWELAQIYLTYLRPGAAPRLPEVVSRRPVSRAA